MTPGVAPDPRGVVLGRFGLLVFPTLEGLVSWFRLYSAESSLDELLPGMRIERGVTPLRSRAMLLRIPATSSYAMDRSSRCARLVGGATFTGTSKHFVKYRDDRSPYGYDAVEIQALPKGADLMVHGEDFSQTYLIDGEMAFEKLLYRLSLRRVPGADRLRDDERRELLVTAAQGLGDGIIRYLWRNRVEARVALVTPKGKTSFDEPGGQRSYLLLRVRDLPVRVLSLFLQTPGIGVFRQVAPNVAVQVGFHHVIDLGSCASLFESGDFHVFWGEDDRVDVIAGPLEFAGIENLTRIDLQSRTAEERRSERAAALPEVVGVRLRLAPSLAPPRRVIGTLVPLDRVDWVKRLIYMLPQSALRGHRIAVTERGVILVAPEQIELMPLGELLSELAPGLMVPLGMDLVPRVAPEVLASALGHGAGKLTVFPHAGEPFQVPETALSPLERRAVAKIEVQPTDEVDTRLAPVGDPTVVNEAVGRFALWGFHAPKESG